MWSYEKIGGRRGAACCALMNQIAKRARAPEGHDFLLNMREITEEDFPAFPRESN
jgi:hypothetical protein